MNTFIFLLFSMICTGTLRDPALAEVPAVPNRSFPAHDHVCVAVSFDRWVNATVISDRLLMKDLTSFHPWWSDSGNKTRNFGMMIVSP